MDYASGKHKGFAFIEYVDAEDAKEAIYNLDGSELFGRVLSVSLAQNNQTNSNKALWSSDDFFQTSEESKGTDGNNPGGDNIESSLKEDGMIANTKLAH